MHLTPRDRVISPCETRSFEVHQDAGGVAPRDAGPSWCAHTYEDGMKGDERRTREMGVRVVLDSDRHPDTDPAHAVLVGKLKGVVGQMEQEEGLQRSALMDRHTSALDK